MSHFSISCALFFAPDALDLTSNRKVRWPPLFCGVGKWAVLEKESRPFGPGWVPPVSSWLAVLWRGHFPLGAQKKAFSVFRIRAGWRGKGLSPTEPELSFPDWEWRQWGEWQPSVSRAEQCRECQEALGGIIEDNTDTCFPEGEGAGC